LLVGATAAFMTTPPPLTNLLNYNIRGVYALTLLAYALLLGGLVVGSSITFVLSKCTSKWFVRVCISNDSYVFAILIIKYRQTHLGSKPRALGTVMLLAYPFISVGGGTVAILLGKLTFGLQIYSALSNTVTSQGYSLQRGNLVISYCKSVQQLC
jgi:hypothetical protein